MKKIAAAVATAALALLPGLAAATPYTLYQFEVTSIQCSIDVPGSDCPGLNVLEQLDGIRVGVAKGSNSASITALTHSRPYGPGGSWVYWTEDYSNTNVVQFFLAALSVNVNTTKSRCESEYYCLLAANFSFGDTIDGGFSLWSMHDEIVMDTSAPGVWSGYVKTDDGPTTEDWYPMFSGRWYETPEPGTAALLGAGLAGLIGWRRRKAA